MLLLLFLNKIERNFIDCFYKGYLKINELSEKNVEVIKEIFGIE